MDALGIDQVFLVGNSMGGALALAIVEIVQLTVEIDRIAATVVARAVREPRGLARVVSVGSRVGRR